MILEAGTDEELKHCAVDACLPLLGEWWDVKRLMGGDMVCFVVYVRSVGSYKVKCETGSLIGRVQCSMGWEFELDEWVHSVASGHLKQCVSWGGTSWSLKHSSA